MLSRIHSFAAGLPLPLFIAMTALATPVRAAAPLPEAAQLPIQTEWPNPLATFQGAAVTTKKLWVKERRPELKGLFQHYMYGTMPPPVKISATLTREDKAFFGGKATLKEVTIALGPPAAPRIHLLLVVPNHRRKAAPVFLGLSFCGNHALVTDTNVALPTGWMPKSCAGCADNHATDAGRGTQVDVWALEQSIDRGYAVATFYNGDVEPDQPDAPEGIRRFYQNAGQSYDWGAIAAWAWGLSCAVDYLITEKSVDPKRIAVVGHSRNGKAAMLAAAFDERIALAIPLQAGCGGTSPSRGKIGESVKRINTSFPHWFNAEFKKFNEQPERLPFDQHCLVALMAPRPVLLANATEDTWANPEGQFEVLQAAEPVYRLLKAGKLDAKKLPPTGQLVESQLGFYIRPGKHSMTTGDWKVFLDFADRHLR